MEPVAEIEWKGIIWKGAHADLSVKELLTILKGFGPMEILSFEKRGHFHGELSLSLTPEGVKEITLYYLEVPGVKRRGLGRASLRELRRIFGGELYVQDAGIIRVKNASDENFLFWLKMCREGLIDALESESYSLHRHISDAEIQKIILNMTGRRPGAHI
jgi:hypothetical protein